ncbi:hypothetical protein [Arthrobacter monumenti]
MDTTLSAKPVVRPFVFSVVVLQLASPIGNFQKSESKLQMALPAHGCGIFPALPLSTSLG